MDTATGLIFDPSSPQSAQQDLVAALKRVEELEDLIGDMLYIQGTRSGNYLWSWNGDPHEHAGVFRRIAGTWPRSRTYRRR